MLNTGYGVAAVIIWSATICLSRSLMEKLGIFTASGSVYLLGGALLILFCIKLNPLNLGKFKFNPKYTAARGIPFTLHLFCLCLALGLAKNQRQVIEIGLINYLWPVFTLVFSVPLLKNKAGPWLAPGIVIAFSGIFVASVTMSGLNFSLPEFLRNIQGDPFPYLLALAAALLWGLYSNLTRCFAQHSNALNVPLFLFAAGLLLGGAGLIFPEKPNWSVAVFIELAVMALLPCAAAFVLWDCAMRRGDMVLVASFAYFTPLLSTVLSGIYLGVDLTFGVWIACALVIAGAWVCKVSVKGAA